MPWRGLFFCMGEGMDLLALIQGNISFYQHSLGYPFF